MPIGLAIARIVACATVTFLGFAHAQPAVRAQPSTPAHWPRQAMSPAQAMPPPLIIAHRGASHDAPENTLAAFKLAWEQGADGIEGDFRLSADGEVVCVHDAEMERTAGESMAVEQTALAELQQMDVGSWKADCFATERTPTLRQVIATVPSGKYLFVELKCGPEIVEPTAEVLEDSSLNPQQVVLISFDAEVIAACRRRLPEYPTQWLTKYKRTLSGWSPNASQAISQLQACGAAGLGCKAEQKCFDASFIRQLNAAGFNDWGVWTVDDPAIARYYHELGTWSITTNRPGWLREQLALPAAE
ncbi:MAG: glycerophosphodiester phosphodiesterase [Planctomycetota bacterium]